MARRIILALAVGAAAISGCATSSRPLFPSPSLPGSAISAAPEPEMPADLSPDVLERVETVQPFVLRAARTHQLDPALLNGVIWVESRFDSRAKSPAGARGLMQLMPATAASLAQTMGMHRPRPYDPSFNVAAGSLYLARLRDRYDGDLELALAAYNAGAGNVDRWVAEGDLPPRSRAYVARVLTAQARFSNRPSAVPPPERLPAARPTAVAVTRPSAPEPAPPPARPAPAPPRFAEEVRYDLDRVESTYVPAQPPSEPPLHGSARPLPSKPVRARQEAPAPVPAAAVPEPRLGRGILPSVLE